MSDEQPKKEKTILKNLFDLNSPGKALLQETFAERLYNNSELRKKLSAFFSTIEKTTLAFNSFGAPQRVFADIAKMMQKAKNYRNKIYPEVIKNINFYAEQCWFLSLLVDLKSYEAQALSVRSLSNDPQKLAEIDTSFIKFYEEWFDYLASNATTKFPHRKFALQPAFDAHKRGEHALSIPVFFAQADGILFELTQRELFTSQSHISKYAQEKIKEGLKQDHLIKLFDEAIWTPISETRPMGWTKSQRGEYNGLNRHTTMHGLDLNYASRTNSFKAFSLLSYIVSIEDVLSDESCSS